MWLREHGGPTNDDTVPLHPPLSPLVHKSGNGGNNARAGSSSGDTAVAKLVWRRGEESGEGERKAEREGEVVELPGYQIVGVVI